jgi:hypothetical protein
MEQITFNTVLKTNSRNHGHGLDLQVRVHHLNATMLRRPGLRAEGAEGEHGLIEEDDLLLVHLRQLDQGAHADEQLVVLLVGEVDFLLYTLNELKLDLVPLVQAPQSGHRYPDLAIAAVEPLYPLLQ